MNKEMKICVPIYKLIYSLAFIVLLSVVRGVGYVDEIGVAMQSAIALLAIVFCADTYLTEIQSHRGEVFHLYDTKHKSTVIFRRIMIQDIYLFGISLLGYGCFYLQKPTILSGTSQISLFAMFALAIAGTILFWSVVSMTICNLWRNMWAGIGTTLGLWIVLSSQFGHQIFGDWNVFSYTYRVTEEAGNMWWLCGEAVSIMITFILVLFVPVILKKRG